MREAFRLYLDSFRTTLESVGNVTIWLILSQRHPCSMGLCRAMSFKEQWISDLLHYFKVIKFHLVNDSLAAPLHTERPVSSV